MRFSFFLFILTLMSSLSFGVTEDDLIESNILSERGSFKPLNKSLFQENILHLEMSEFQEMREELTKAKYYLLNGQIYSSLHELKNATRKKRNPFSAIFKRYQGIIEFISGNYQKSYEVLNDKELQLFGNYKKVCALKTTLQIILNETLKLREEWERCKVENAIDPSFSSSLWMDVLVKLKLGETFKNKNDFLKGSLLTLSNDDLVVMLKLLLYLNQEHLILPYVESFDYSTFYNSEVRQLIGHLLYRQGKLVKAWRYLQDLEDVNSENLKGSMYLQIQKEELAYAQFKLAMKKKPNSQNAIERALPISWILDQWQDGLRYSKLLEKKYMTNQGASLISAAFLTKLNRPYDAVLEVAEILKLKGGETPLAFNQLYALNHFKLKKKDLFVTYSQRACRQYDLIACWNLYLSSIWEEFFFLNQENQSYKRDSYFQDKLIRTHKVNKLRDEEYIDPVEINELDGEMINLIKGL